MSNNKQSSVNEEFVLYEEALALKELGFDESCFAIYGKSEGDLFKIHTDKFDTVYELHFIKAPTFSQAFRWFRDNYGYSHSITEHEIIEGQTDLLYIDESEEFQGIEWLARVQPGFIETFKSYEEAELACLKSLIKIVKEKQNEQETK